MFNVVNLQWKTIYRAKINKESLQVLNIQIQHPTNQHAKQVTHLLFFGGRFFGASCGRMFGTFVGLVVL